MATRSASSKAVGTIEFVAGEVRATALEGTFRILQAGDRVFAKEVISTSANAVVQVHLENGSVFDLGRDSMVTLDDHTLSARDSTVGLASAQHDGDEIPAALAPGADLTRVAAAAAAGPEAPAANGGEQSSSEHVLIVVEQANTTGEVTSGSTAQSASVGFPPHEPGRLAAQEEPAFLVQEGLPFPVRDASPVASVPMQMQAPVDTSHESPVTSRQSLITGSESPVTSRETVANTDKLSVSDLLRGDHAEAGNPTAHLHFTYDSGTNTTTMEVKWHGAAGAVEQKIVLAGVDLAAGGTLTTDSAMMQNLLTHTTLHTDV